MCCGRYGGLLPKKFPNLRFEDSMVPGGSKAKKLLVTVRNQGWIPILIRKLMRQLIFTWIIGDGRECPSIYEQERECLKKRLLLPFSLDLFLTPHFPRGNLID